MDYMVRATAADDRVRAFVCTATDMVEKARRIHNTSPVATAALGRLLAAGSMMGLMMKGENDVLTIIVKGDGPVGKLTVTADSKGNVKGYPDEPNVIIPAKSNGKLDVGGAVGSGHITIIRDLGLKEPYVGQVELVNGEIAEDLTYYFTASEQIPSAVGLGVLMDKANFVKRAGGFIIQLMPETPEEVIKKLESNLASVTSVTSMMEEGLTPEGITHRLLAGLEIKFFERSPMAFKCNCSRERMIKALISIGEKELEKLVEEKEPAELVCHFCKEKYVFSVADLQEILELVKSDR